MGGSSLALSWRTVWEQAKDVVCRIYHTERLVAYHTLVGEWRAGDVAAARQGRLTKQKRQQVTVAIRSCLLRLT
jgi:hypothetical protein